MRAFVGIDLDPALREALVAGCDEIKFAESGWRDQKWVPRENLHLTLKFLGDIPNDAFDEFTDDLRAALAGVAGFSLPVAHLFAPVPSVKRATMIWSTLDDPDGRCADLADRVDEVAGTFGVLPDTRDFTPHITLCRAIRPRALRSAEAAEEKARGLLAPGEAAPTMSVGAVTFFTSTLTRQRPEYEQVSVIPLD